jgi:hypothetical protein
MSLNQNFGNYFYQPPNPVVRFSNPRTLRRVDPILFDGKLNYTSEFNLSICPSSEILEIKFDGQSSPLVAYLIIRYISGQPVLFTRLPSDINRRISEYAMALPSHEDEFRSFTLRVDVQHHMDFPFLPPRFALPKEVDFPKFFIDKFNCFSGNVSHDFSPVFRTPDKHILIFNHYMDILDSMQRLYKTRSRRMLPSSAVVIGNK